MIKMIQVSEKDKKEGLASNCNECPIARAILRRVKKGVLINVGSFAGRVGFVYNDEVKNITYCDETTLPEKAYDWYCDFDYYSERGRLTMPLIRFELDIPDWAVK